MPNIEKLLIQDVEPGDVLADDVFINRTLFMKKDSILTAKALELLKKKSIKYLSIYYKEKCANSFEFPILMEDTLINFSDSSLSGNEDEFNFYAILAELDIEIRYGQLLKEEGNIDYLQDILEDILSNSANKYCLSQLKKWDYHSYLHSIDVFIIGTLFARHLKIEQVEKLALGYLLHDIGKLKIPQQLLQKPGRLTAKEFDLMKTHTLYGEAILKQIGLSDLSYLAKSHHERRNGEGYPESMQINFKAELELLQIIDVYSAITMKRPYRDAMRAADAFSLLYRDEEKYNSILLTEFVDFIGIYPENSIVLLSNGHNALVQKANPQFPTSPRVKCMKTNTSLHISINNDITILKMVSYQSEDKIELLNLFYNELVSANVENAKKTYLKIVDNFTIEEYFTKIFIPVYQILNLLKMQKAISNTKYDQVVAYMEQLMEQKVDELIENDSYHDHVLILIDDHVQSDYFFKVFIGLIHNNRISPHVMPVHSSLEMILTKLDTQNFSKTCFITNGNTDTLLLSYLPNMYEMPQSKIEKYLIDLIGDNKDNFDFHYLLERFGVPPSTIIH
ncbi:HD domain-containing phosphohydrolase [Solibacillus sp. FSL W8-0372]|uniref:HD-GYP domain-containing protein n=1 Tax=Solibacillus sp. FSL W8-0372 TaxID=2921713 RepID=UPI0030CD7BC5